VEEEILLNREAFGSDFKWGVSVSAYQIEGAHQDDGKGHSIWDIFSNKKGKIHLNHNGNNACEFYSRFEHDLGLIKYLNIPNFRFSLSWPRIQPTGHLPVNQKGIDFYDRLIDHALKLGIEPWVTLYHWDLPHALEIKGGWTNRDVVSWFEEYVNVCVNRFGDRVKYWMVLNEPMVFVGAGYFLGIHAPGRRGMKHFIPAVHHSTLCMGAGGRIIKSALPNAEVGTTFSCSHIEPYRDNEKDALAANKIDALLNRLFIEPVLGLGYPSDDLKPLKNIDKYFLPNDENLLPFDFDFIGVQNYTREVVKRSLFVPYVGASIVKASERNVERTLMNWEVYPESIYHILKKFNDYPTIKKLIVTENGAAFTDRLHEGKVSDVERVDYLKRYTAQVLRAKSEGVNVQGYFIWTLTDNFEWAEGFHPRFGIIYIDFKTQQRIIKSSGLWYKDFLSL
jgi:beta-glucosidase